MKNVLDKNIWIIGASSGIGRALAVLLAREGARLIISARSQKPLDELRQEIGTPHQMIAFDVADYQLCLEATKKAKSIFSKIDSVIFMAAHYQPAPIDQMNIEQAHKTIAINLGGAFNITHAILPLLQQQNEGQFILCASVAGYRGLPNGQPYSATKAAIINFAESLRAEQTNLDIKVMNPGFVRTPMTAKNQFNMPMMIEPEQAAQAIFKGMKSKKFEIHFPKKFSLLMKLLRLMPASLYFKIASKIN